MRSYWSLVYSTVAVMAFSACSSVELDPPASGLIKRDAKAVVDATEIIVVTPSPYAATTLKRGAARRGYTLFDERMLPGLDIIMLSFNIPGGISGAAAIKDLEVMAPDVTAGVNHRYLLQDVTAIPPASKSQSQIEGAKSFAAGMIGWPKVGCPANVRIGVIDAAIDDDVVTDPNAVIVKEDFTGNNAAAPERRHATAIVNILLENARLNGAEVFNAAVVADRDSALPAAGVDTLMRALNWLLVSNVKIANVSLAGPYNKILDIGFQRAAAKGMIVVAAAGNEGRESPPRYPAAFKDVIAVTAVDVRGSVFKDAVHGRHIDVSAPGVDVFVDADDKGGRFMSGTSIAVPFVVARLAADEAISEVSTPEEARRLLRENARDLGDVGTDPVFGAGLITAASSCQDLSRAQQFSAVY